MKLFKYRVLYDDGTITDFFTKKAAMRAYLAAESQFDLFDEADYPFGPASVALQEWRSGRWVVLD